MAFGNGGNGGSDPAAIARAALRERQILELRAARVPMTDIAAQLGISISRCSHIYKRAMQRLPHPSVEAMREEDNALIDRLIRALFPKAVGRPATASSAAVPPEEAAVREIRLLLQRRARLNGMDAPVRIDARVEMVDGDSLDEEIARLERELARNDRHEDRAAVGTGPASETGVAAEGQAP